MSFCAQCGQAVNRDWSNCAACGAKVQELPTAPRTPMIHLATRVILTIGVVAFLMGLTLPYQRTSQPGINYTIGLGEAFYLPILLLALLIIVTTWLPGKLAFASALSIGLWLEIVRMLLLQLWDSDGLEIGTWLVGAYCIAISGIAVTSSIVANFRMGVLKFRLDGISIVWAGSSVLLALIWIAGNWMPWVRYTERLTGKDWTFPDTGTNLRESECCYLFKDVTDWSLQTSKIFEIVGLIGAALLLAFIIPRSAAALGIIGIGVLLMSHTFSFVVSLSNVVDLKNWYDDPEVISKGGATVEISSLPGGWIATFASVGFILLGAFMYLSGRLTTQSATEPEVGIKVAQSANEEKMS